MSEKNEKKYRRMLARQTAEYFNATKTHIEQNAVREFVEELCLDSLWKRIRFAFYIVRGAKK